MDEARRSADDGDGDDDLLVTGYRRTTLYRNRGDGTFQDVTGPAGVGSDRWSTAAGFADLDGDGDLDLVVITYVDADPSTAPKCRDSAGRPIHCPPGRFAAQADHLFRNNGDGTFTDVAASSGFDAPDGRGLGLAIVDVDDDGLLDIYVANDAVPDHLYRNLGGLRFEERGLSAGVAYGGDGQATASMGVVAEDLDGDGRPDILHTNFRYEGTTLHRNLGDGLFADVTAASGLDGPTRSVTGFGAAAVDLDADGDLDLVMANGHVDDLSAAGQPMAQPPQVFEATAPGRFAIAPASGYFARQFVGRGLAAGDLDNDGRVDLVVVHRDAPSALLRNELPGGHWLGLSLRGRPPACRTPVGALVTCRVGERILRRRLSAGTGYLSCHDRRIHRPGRGPGRRGAGNSVAFRGGRAVGKPAGRPLPGSRRRRCRTAW
ncbi:MAG: VCBS repeat-containing protein [Isosphaeraceae bacterium]